MNDLPIHAAGEIRSGRRGELSRHLDDAPDAGAAVQTRLPRVRVRDDEHVHALEELDALAAVTVETLEQPAQAIAYVCE